MLFWLFKNVEGCVSDASKVVHFSKIWQHFWRVWATDRCQLHLNHSHSHFNSINVLKPPPLLLSSSHTTTRSFPNRELLSRRTLSSWCFEDNLLNVYWHEHVWFQLTVALFSIIFLLILSSSYGYIGIWVALTIYMSLRALAGFGR